MSLPHNTPTVRFRKGFSCDCLPVFYGLKNYIIFNETIFNQKDFNLG